MKLTLPNNALQNEDLHGRCIVDGKMPPHIIVLYGGKCKLKILKVKTNVLGYSMVDFVVKNVTETCVYRCLFFRAKETKKVPVKGMLHTYVYERMCIGTCIHI